MDEYKSYWYCKGRIQEDSLLMTYSDVYRKMMHLGLHPHTPDAQVLQELKNANRFFLTLYLDVCPDTDAKANGLMQRKRHWTGPPSSLRYSLVLFPPLSV
jgi:hypothetical protein